MKDWAVTLSLLMFGFQVCVCGVGAFKGLLKTRLV